MIKRIINMLKRTWNKYEIKFYSPYTVSNYYRNKFGVRIGGNCRIMDKRINLFGSEPYLIEIGNNVTITEGVRFVTHDGGVVLFRTEHPGLNVYGKIQINDDCFIGTGAIIMPNVKIGPKAVVGAGAVVTRDVPEATVVVGIPAKVLCTMEQYKKHALAKGVVIRSLDTNIRKQEILNSFESKL